MQPTLREMFEHLGADPVTARRLAHEGLDPMVLLALDHPDSGAFDMGPTAWARYGDDWETALVMSFPAFDPTVLERVSRSLWSAFEWMTLTVPFPGPLNRLCAIAEGGVHPEICDFVVWGAEAGKEMVEVLDDLVAECVADCAAPVLVTDGEAAIEISLGGTTLSPAACAQQALHCMGGASSPVIRFLSWWNSVIRSSWPGAFSPFVHLLEENLIIESHCDNGHKPFQHLRVMRETVMAQRLRAIAPGLQGWHAAFVDEHPGF